MKNLKLPALCLAFAVGFSAPALADCVLRQSDAIELQFGPFVDSSDGFTPQTGLTISQADVRLSKCTAAGDCAAWAQASEATAATHGENGWYEKDLDATDTNTVGILMIAINESGALPVFKECLVIETAIYDDLYADGALGLAKAAALDAVDNYVDTEVADILTDTSTTLDDFLDAEIATLLSQTSAATLESEANDALVALHLDHLLAVTYDPASKPGAADALLNELIESDAGVSRYSANALEQAPTGSGESLAAIADAVWDEALAGHAGAGSTGEALTTASSAAGLDAAGVRAAVGLASANLDTQLSNIDNFIDTEVADILTDTSTTLDDYIDTEIADIRRALGPATTTIASLSSQTSFTLTAGSADDNAYNGYGIVIVDASTPTQTALGCVSDYTGSTRTITLREDPAIFTMANTDIAILLPSFCTLGVDVQLIEGVDATDQLDAHAAAGLDAAGVRAAIGLGSANLDSQLSTIDNFIDTEVADILLDTGTTLDDLIDTEIATLVSQTTAASIRSGVGLASANLDTQLSAIDDFVDTEVATAVTQTTAASIRTAVGLASANLDTQIAALESGVDIDTIEGTDATDIIDARIAAAGLATAAALDTVDNFVDTEITMLLNARTQLIPAGDADGILTADSGDTNTLVDTELTFANDVDLDGAYVVRSDAQRCFIDSFSAASDTIEFGACTFTGAWSTQTYKIYPAGTQ